MVNFVVFTQGFLTLHLFSSWDWTLDAHEPWNSLIFTPEFFGKPDPKKNYQVVTGAFSADKYSEPIDGLPLVRAFNPEGPTGNTKNYIFLREKNTTLYSYSHSPRSILAHDPR